jgi:hypothetical protein
MQGAVVSVEQYPCALSVVGETLFVGTSALTGEQWSGALLARSAVSASSAAAAAASSSLMLRHGVAQMAVVSDALLVLATDGPKLETVHVHQVTVVKPLNCNPLTPDQFFFFFFFFFFFLS